MLRARTSLSLALLLAACTTPPDGAPDTASADAPDKLAALFADDVTVVDLTHAVSAEAPYWPGPDRSPFVHDTLSAHEDGAPAMAAYAVPEHFGTHFDAPVHGGMGLASVDQVPTSELFGPAVVVDVTSQSEEDEDYAVSVDDLRAWEADHGEIPSGAIVVMRSGWPSRWQQGDPYYNRGTDGRLHFPGFSEEAARFLVDERDIAGIGVDTGSVDPGNTRGYPAHGVVNGSGRFHLENLADMSALPEAGAYLIVAPIKIAGGSGGQVRVFAVGAVSSSRRRLQVMVLTALQLAACSANENDAAATYGAPQVIDAGTRAILLDPTHAAWSESAPDTFRARFETTRGAFVLEVVRAWAPIGADRFYNLIRHGYYDDVRFHRTVPGFITQWGVSGDPEVSAVWYERGMADDTVVASNERGTMAFAFTDPGTRSTQIYISMVDNSRLDVQGFAPFGRVVEGMDSVVDSIYSGYGENSGGGVRRGDQSRIVSEGNAYLDGEFPELDRLLRVMIERR